MVSSINTVFTQVTTKPSLLALYITLTAGNTENKRRIKQAAESAPPLYL